MPTGKKAAPSVLETNGAPEDELTPKQRLFVEHYLKLRNGVQAAKAAGYRGSYATLDAMARQNLGIPRIKAAIERGMNALVKRVQYSHDDVIRMLAKIHDRCMQEEEVLDRQGNPTGEFKFEAHGALRATELIGKHFGMWKEKKDADEGSDRRPSSDDYGRVRAALQRAKRK